MKQNLKRLTRGELEQVQRYIRYVKARRWAINHAIPLAICVLILAIFPTATQFDMLAEWLVLVAVTGYFFRSQHSRPRPAHWVSQTQPRR